MTQKLQDTAQIINKMDAIMDMELMLHFHFFNIWVSANTEWILNFKTFDTGDIPNNPTPSPLRSKEYWGVTNLIIYTQSLNTSIPSTSPITTKLSSVVITTNSSPNIICNAGTAGSPQNCIIHWQDTHCAGRSRYWWKSFIIDEYYLCRCWSM